MRYCRWDSELVRRTLWRWGLDVAVVRVEGGCLEVGVMVRSEAWRGADGRDPVTVEADLRWWAAERESWEGKAVMDEGGGASSNLGRWLGLEVAEPLPNSVQ